MGKIPKGVVKIYDVILEIKAQKGNDSLWPQEYFVHKFSRKSHAEIFGLPNGDILIKSKVGKRLWKPFTYDEREGSRR